MLSSGFGFRFCMIAVMLAPLLSKRYQDVLIILACYKLLPTPSMIPKQVLKLENRALRSWCGIPEHPKAHANIFMDQSMCEKDSFSSVCGPLWILGLFSWWRLVRSSKNVKRRRSSLSWLKSSKISTSCSWRRRAGYHVNLRFCAGMKTKTKAQARDEVPPLCT